MFEDSYNGSGKKFVYKCGFSETIAAGVDGMFEIRSKGAGQSISQSGGRLNLVSGTVAGEETLIRSINSMSSPLTLKQSAMLPRTLNNNYAVELVDVIAKDAPFTINSATSLSITVPNTVSDKFKTYIGGTIRIGACTGALNPSAVATGSRWTIAAVTDGVITLTVAGFPASGTGTLDLYGFNSIGIRFEGSSTTVALQETYRNGYGANDALIANDTSIAAGTMWIVDVQDGVVVFQDEQVATSTNTVANVRGRRIAQIPDVRVPMYLQIRQLNAFTVSSVTRNIDFISVEDYNPQHVTIEALRPMANNYPMPVVTMNPVSAPVNVSGTPRGSSNNGGQPLYVATGNTAVPYAVTAGRNVDLLADLVGRIVVQVGGLPTTQDRNRVTLTATTETTLIAAVASNRHGLHSITIANRDNVAHTIDVRETTAGTIVQSIIVPAGVTLDMEFTTGLWAAAVNTNFTVQARAVPTTAVEISCLSYRVPF